MRVKRRLGRSTVVVAAQPLPAWLPAVGAVANLASSTLTSSGVGWSGTSPGGSSDYQSIVTQWGGGVLNTTGIWRAGAFVPGAFLCLWGGGHGSYAGNEVYAFGPLAGTPSWSRILDPTVPGVNNTGRSGGYPTARHTFDALVYLESTNQMLCMGVGGRYSDGGSMDLVDLFDFDIDPGSGNPWSAADTSFPAMGSGVYGLVSAIDAATGAAWGVGRGNSKFMVKYLSGSWSSWSIDNPITTFASKGAIDSTHTVLAFLESDGTLRAVDLRTPTATVYTPSTTGSGPGVDAVLEWDAAGSRFVAWPGSGNVFYFLTPPADPYSGGSAWAWTSTTASGASVATQTASGTFGRFRMVTGGGYRGALLMPAQNQPISFYRLS